MCRNCGSIVGAGQQQCAVCGTPVNAAAEVAQPRMVADHETVRFARAVLDRPYKFTIILLVVNIFIFILMWQISQLPFSLLTPLPNEVLLPFGAKANYFIYRLHQWWRFVTPMFLHVNVLHLMVNMYSLWIVGPYVEKLYGSAKFLLFWVATGIAGVVASYLTVRPSLATGALSRFIFKAVDEPSAGASGALFGMVGVLFVFGIKFRHELPEGFKRAFGTGLLPMIFLNLFIGYIGRGFIDNAAHLGGMTSGALLALVVDYRRPGETVRNQVLWRVLQVAAILIVAISFFKTAQHLRDPLPAQYATPQTAPVVQTDNPNFLQYAKAVNDGQDAFVVAVQDGNASNIDAAVKKLDAAPALDPKADDLRRRLKDLLQRAAALQPEQAATPSRDKTKLAAKQQLVNDFNNWSLDYKHWLKTDAKRHSGL
jgi:rhomboid protease GluP